MRVNHKAALCFEMQAQKCYRTLIMPKSRAQDHILHVLVAIPHGPAGQGGIGRIMTSLLQELERQDRTDLDVQFVVTRGPGHVAWSLLDTLRFCVGMVSARLRSKLDVVHLNVAADGSTYRKMIIAACARLLGTPYVVHLHGSRYQTFWKDGQRGMGALIRRFFEAASRVIVLGHFWQEFVAGKAPRSAENIVIVPNATEVPSLPINRGEGVHVLFLGRLGERKGVPQLIDALTRMSHIPEWRATIAGDGEVEAARMQARGEGLADRVALPGWVGPDHVAALIASADILVLPSFAENLPISVIEGMAAGLAVVATPVGAVEDIILHERTGLLVAPGDVEALTAALTRLVEDRSLRQRLGAAAMALHRDRLELGAFARTIVNVWTAAANRRHR